MKSSRENGTNDRNPLGNWANILLYAIAFFVLIASQAFGWHPAMLLFPLVLFAGYDLWFALHPKIWEEGGKTVSEALESIGSASQYTTYFVGFIGVVLSVMVSNPAGQEVLQMFRQVWYSAYGIGILVSAGTLLLFIPVAYRRRPDNEQEASWGLRACFGLVVFLQKTVVLLVIYLLLEMLAKVVGGN